MIWTAIMSIGDDNTDSQNGQFVRRQFALADFVPQALQALSQYGTHMNPILTEVRPPVVGIVWSESKCPILTVANVRFRPEAAAHLSFRGVPRLCVVKMALCRGLRGPSRGA